MQLCTVMRMCSARLLYCILVWFGLVSGNTVHTSHLVMHMDGMLAVKNDMCHNHAAQVLVNIWSIGIYSCMQPGLGPG